MISEPTHTTDGPVMGLMPVPDTTAMAWVAVVVPQLSFRSVYR